MRIVIAPDKFKGTLTAREAAEAIARGARAAIPEAEMTLRPVADGGDGTLEALLVGLGGREQEVEVTGPMGDSVIAHVAFLSDGRAAVEMAQCSGMALLADAQRDALRAHSLGTGEAIAAALRADARTLLVGVGGSASSDGGTGAARAIGYRFLDARGSELPLGGGQLVNLAAIDAPGPTAGLEGVEVVGACDVDNPLVGDRGAARTFGPQKGASPAGVERLEEGLLRLAEVVQRDLGIDVTTVPGGGSGGGMGAGLVAFFGARLAEGFDAVAKATGLAGAIAGAKIVITGEGRLDRQSLGGKAPIGVAELASAADVRCYAVAGEVLVDRKDLVRRNIRAAVSLVETVGEERALADVPGAIYEATRKMLRESVLGGKPKRLPLIG